MPIRTAPAFNRLNGNIWWIGPFVLVLLRILHLDARLSRVEHSAGVLIFRAARSVRMMLLIGVAGFSAGILTGITREEPWVLIAASVLVMLLCFSWPSAIVIDAEGIHRQLWWRPTLVLQWGSVTAIEKAGAELQVFGKDGQSIAFSRYHADQGRFEREVIERSGVKRTMSASAPPTLHR